MKFITERANKGDGLTFSEEGVITLLVSINDYFNRMLAKVIKDGFEKGEPAEKLEIDVNWKVNDKEIDDRKILEQYPKLLGFSSKALLESLQEKVNKEEENE